MKWSGGREIHDYRIICQIHTTTGGQYDRTTTQQQLYSPNHVVPRTYCCCIMIFKILTICTWTSFLSSPLYASTPMYVLQRATLNLDRSIVGTQYRPLNWSNSQLTSFETFEKKRVQHTLPAGSAGTMQAHLRPPPT